MTIKKTLLIGALALAAITLSAQEKSLPKPPAKFGLDLATAIETRKSFRQFTGKEISPAELSAILWASSGVTWKAGDKASVHGADTVAGATEGGRKTTVSAFGVDYVSTYVLLADGSYRYDPVRSVLVRTGGTDVRKTAMLQDFPGRSAVIVYVAEAAALAKIPAVQGVNEEAKVNWAYSSAGLSAQNAYLAAGAQGWGAVLIAFVNEGVLRPALGLAKGDRVLLTLQIGSVR